MLLLHVKSAASTVDRRGLRLRDGIVEDVPQM